MDKITRTLALTFIFTALSSGLAFSGDSPRYKLATLDWPPYISPQVRDDGYVAKLVSRAFELGGASAEYTFLPWARALLDARQGQSVGLFPEYYDESRLDQFIFSDAFPGGPVGLLKLKERDIEFATNPEIDQKLALSQLSNYSFGVVRGYLNTPEFDKADFLTKIQTRSDESNLRMLMVGRVDMIFIDKFVADFIIRTDIPELEGRVAMLEPALAYKPLYIAFSKQHPMHERARETFNRGLKELQSSGELSRLLFEFKVLPKASKN